MPYIEKSTYNPKSFINRNAHLSTIIPGVMKKYPIPDYTREKWEIEDGDFLLLDWKKQHNKDKIVILSHGLEGNSRRTYMNTCCDYFFKKGFSVLSWNQRSCGGEMNRNFRLYHHGAIDDLGRVISKADSEGYKEIYLIGFSLGGAQILNYLGRTNPNPKVIKAISVSAPLMIKDSVTSLRKFPNTIYMKNFINDLVPKLKIKAEQFPNRLPIEKLKNVKNFDVIDDYFTAPMHGFKNKEDYYESVSPLPYIENIKIPTLLINAWNDPFIDTRCYPVKELKENKTVYFETPKYGGHCGFPLDKNIYSWVEIRAEKFITKI